jgi:hypothetical protein
MSFIAPFPGSSAVSLTFTDHNESPSGTTTHTYTGLNFGPAAADRCIVVGIAWVTASPTLTSCTIGGVAARIIKQLGVAGSTNVSVALCIARVPAGTTGTVVANFSSSAVYGSITVYQLTGCSSGIESSSASSGVAAPTATLAILPGGAMIGVAFTTHAGAITSSWAGLVQDVGTFYSSVVYRASAHANLVTAQPALTATCTFSATFASSAGVFAAFGP